MPISPSLKKSCVLLCILSLFWLSTSGCSEAPKPAEQAEQKAEEGGDSGDAEAPEEPSSNAPASTDPTVVEMRQLPFVEIEIPTKDKRVLYGKLYDPTQHAEGEETEAAPSATDASEEEQPSKKYPLIILIHALNGSHRDWQNLPARLVKAGYAVFALDLRGHGKSGFDLKTHHHSDSWRIFQAEDWLKMPEDVLAVPDFFNKSADYKDRLDLTRMGIIGAGLGANVGLIAAGKLHAPVRAIILLSPSLSYKGLDTVLSLVDYTNAILITASKQDPFWSDKTETLFRFAQGPKSLRLYKNIGHGTEMLRQNPQLIPEFVQWLDQQPTWKADLPKAPVKKKAETEPKENVDDAEQP